MSPPRERRVAPERVQGSDYKAKNKTAKRQSSVVNGIINHGLASSPWHAKETANAEHRAKRWPKASAGRLWQPADFSPATRVKLN
jgi:hypothetical protein